jgi:cell division transport system permease protein
LHANYVLPDQIALLEKQINTHPIVQKILIDQDLVKLMNDNLERIALFLLVAALVLVLVSISVINSSIRLSIYASRFLIRTMQLVGATQSFIRKPFILRSVLQGLLGGGIAAFIMGGLYQYLTQQYPEMGLLSGWEISLLIGALIMVVGVLISWICTFFAVRKYLKIKTDDLYF